MSTASVNTEAVALAAEAAEQAAAEERRSYGQILKSSALIGGSQALTIAVGIVRTKVMAVLLGPSGVGLMGLYGSVADLAVSVAGMGVNSSGVRQIAEAVGSGDTNRIARTAAVLRRISFILGSLGAILLLAFSAQISALTFGTTQRTAGVSLLSIAVLFRLVSAGQGALIQGMRRVSDLAKMGILGALFGLVITIPLVYFLREDGVVPSLVAVAAMTTLTSWWYTRKIDVPPSSMTTSQVRQEATALLKLGFAFTASGLMMMGSAYVVRIIITHQISVEATGLYQAAWTLGGLYVAFILQAMGADFYPRLTACANDNAASNRLVNEQVHVGLLLAGPGIIATLTFAPVVLALFYSGKFTGAVEILRWLCLGVALRVVSWPMGYIIVAKGEQVLFFWSELAWTAVNLGLTWMLVRSFGLNGSGMAFFGSYIFHGVLIYLIVHHLTDFNWSVINLRTGVFFLCLIVGVFGASFLLPPVWVLCVGTVAMMAGGIYSIRILATILPQERLLGRVLGLPIRLGLSRRGERKVVA